MLIKIVTLFLIVMAVLGMFGAFRMRGRGQGKVGRDTKAGDLPGKPRKCRSCGAFIVGKGKCACGAD